MSPPAPRIEPGSRRDIGWINSVIVAAIARGARTRQPPNIFTTLARHRRLFRGWLWFAGTLMPGGSVPRNDTELVILRVAHNTDCEYEWRHHERLGRAAGLSAEEIERVRGGASAQGWSARQSLLLRVVDDLHERREISESSWQELAGEFTQVQLIELLMLIGHYTMLAAVIINLRIAHDDPGGVLGQRSADRAGDHPLAGRRVLITGAARGIGAATARRLHQRGARVALAGIEPELLTQVAADCGGAPEIVCDVRDREQVEAAVENAVAELGGLDVVIANAGVAAQLPVLGGDPKVFERTMEVNLLGVYYTLRAAGPHIAHSGGYALAISSLGAAVHPPLMGAYSASKAGVEALADALRIELSSSGARVGVAYFAELETEMTSRGFGTEAASRVPGVRYQRVTPLKAGIDAIERGIIRRSRYVVAPGWVAAVLPIRMAAQRVVELVTRRGIDAALEVARAENAPLTTPLPERALSS
jgi:AhpD family alkylhydroperoxidase